MFTQYLFLEEWIDTLSGNEWFSKQDANSTYYQINVNESNKDRTTFITKYGSFQFTRMSFGLCNTPSTYARVMNLVLRGLTWNIVLAFLDDIFVLGQSLEDHQNNLEMVFDRSISTIWIKAWGVKEAYGQFCILF